MTVQTTPAVERHVRGFHRFLRILGPGLITGAADDDPSGIATCTQTGAQFGYGQLWTAIFLLPLITAVQEACARIGAVTGKGIARVVRDRYPKIVLYPVVGLLLVANIINIGADLGAMGAAAHLLLPVPAAVFTALIAAVVLLLEIFTPYATYARILKWLSLAILSYPLTVLVVQSPWGEVLRATFVPNIELTFGFLFIITAVLGTTISPYMFFWEAAEEVEEEQKLHLLDNPNRQSTLTSFLHNVRIDNFIGMLSSQVVTWCVIVVAAGTLHQHGISNVATAADAAAALQPLAQTFPHAGFLAKLLFALGIIGLGLLAVPVLSGSASYAICETLNWDEGLDLKLSQATRFYMVMIVSIVLGLSINFFSVNPVKALVFAAVFNGLAAVPLLFLIARIARNSAIMGQFRSGMLSNALVWLSFAAMAVAAIGVFVTL